MAAQIDKVISELRDMVLSGALQPGERVVELQFSARLGVSRTPLRIALTELEKEGLLERLPSRGFRVRAFTVEEIGDAVDVRGVLEGMAARLLAERGASEAVLAQLSEAVEEGRALLAPARRDPNTTVDARAWGQINRRFHEILCEAAGNRALLSALGYAGSMLVDSAWGLWLAFFVSAAGMGGVFPSFSALAANAVEASEQGATAGSIGAAQGLGVVIGPMAGSLIYAIEPRLPYLLSLIHI